MKALQNKVSDLELRVSAREKFSSKDCLILETMPVKDPMLPLTHQVCTLHEERLPQVQKEIQALADRLGVITTTFNSDVNVFKMMTLEFSKL